MKSLKNRIQNELKELCKKYKLYVYWESINATDSVTVSCMETTEDKRNKTIKILEKLRKKYSSCSQIRIGYIPKREIFIGEETFYCATLYFEYFRTLEE